MNRMAVAGPEPGPCSAPPPVGPREAGPWAAVRSLRRLARRDGAEGGDDALPSSPATARAAAAFGAFLDGAGRVPGARAPVLGAPGSPTPTKDERRLLRALAAAQAGEGAVLDACLCRFALDRRLRASLAEAVRALAAALAAGGVVLPPRAPPAVPAPAPRVARLRGQALDNLHVARPGTPTG